MALVVEFDRLVAQVSQYLQTRQSSFFFDLAQGSLPAVLAGLNVALG
jgi:hypothetical protein